MTVNKTEEWAEEEMVRGSTESRRRCPGRARPFASTMSDKVARSARCKVSTGST